MPPSQRSITPSVLVFDVNETLIDIESLAPLFEEWFGDRRMLRDWFGQLVMYSMATTVAEYYVDFFTLGQGVLRMLAEVYRVDITDDDLFRLQAGMLSMPAHPDVAESLTVLRNNGFRMVTLTNSPPNPSGRTPLEAAGIAGFFEQRFSVDSCRAFKPAAAVYRFVCQSLDVAPADCMMVAAHVWDTLGAQNVGYSSALITRPGNSPLPVERLPHPDLIVRDLRELTERLIS